MKFVSRLKKDEKLDNIFFQKGCFSRFAHLLRSSLSLWELTCSNLILQDTLEGWH